jgi:hypothetical protein
MLAMAKRRFLTFQQANDGRFRSLYSYRRGPARPFDSFYYPGEAVLALLRLHALDGNGRWLQAARRGADWLITERDGDKPVAALPHDQWLLMAMNELHPRVPDARYLTHAQRLAAAILGAERVKPEPLDWVGSFYDQPRSTPSATRSEALVAFVRLAERHRIDSQAHRESLLRLARFQRRCQLTNENVFYVPRPDRALGGFRRGLSDWDIRIDYVQHNISAFLGLRQLLMGT